MNIETKCVQAGWQPHKGEPRELPIYQSTTFKYDTSEDIFTQDFKTLPMTA